MKSYIVIIILIIIIIVYGKYYTNYNKDIKILQVYLDNIKLDILYERYPILIYDQVYNHKQLMNTLFAYSYLFTKTAIISPSIPLINNSKYILISSADNTIINIINPKYKDDAKKNLKFEDTSMQYVSIKLQPKQVLILPSRWIYQSKDELIITKLDDILSFVFLRLV